jgi:MFS family permease
MLLRKIAWRFLPLLILVYLLNYLDRTSISVAALTMNRALGFTATQFGFAAGVFFVGYCLFEVPSNLALYKFGSRIWLTRITITWGLASAATALVTGPMTFYAVRFLLGVAEAGFFPGVIYFLSGWFPKEYRARILAWFMLGIPASSLIGTPIAGLLLGMNGIAGLAGWKWLFLLVSVPVVLVGCVMPFLIVDTPQQARWLSADERSLLQGMLDREVREKHHTSFRSTLVDTRVFILALIQFGFLAGSYGIGVWLPQIFKRSELHVSNFRISILSALPYLFAMVGQILWAAYSDKKDNKIGSIVVSCLLGAAGLFLSVQGHSFSRSVLGITIALIGINAARAIFWAIPPRFLSGAAAAGGFAFINTIGTIGGFVGPYMVGFLKDATGSFTAGLRGMAGLLVLTAIMAGTLKLLMRVNTVESGHLAS